MAHVLFSTDPNDVGLYGKPMARNSQIWTDKYELLLDGPGADREELNRAAGALQSGGQFGYRFFFPPMRVGKYEVFWHRPLVAFRDAKTNQPRLLDDAPAGYFTAYTNGKYGSGPSGRTLARTATAPGVFGISARAIFRPIRIRIINSRSTSTNSWRPAVFSAAGLCPIISPGKF